MTRPLAPAELGTIRFWCDFQEATANGHRTVSLHTAQRLIATVDHALQRARAAEATVAELLTSPTTPGR